MSPSLIGGMIGLFLGLIQFVALKRVSETMARQPASVRTAKLLGAVAWIDVIVFPVAGYMIGGIVGAGA